MKPAIVIRLVWITALVAGAALVWLNLHNRSASPQLKLAAATAKTNALAGAGVARTQPAPAAFTPETRSIIVPDAQTTFSDRVKTIRAINRELTAEECRAFYAYLLAPAHSPAEDRQYENWLRNVMLDKLVRQTLLPEGLADVLVAIYRDREQDVVMRDYALQHITPIYERAGTEEKASLRQVLWQATEETDSSIAGTALLALSNLAQDNAGFDSAQIVGTALKLAGDERCGELTRITALQVCANLGQKQALPLAFQTALIARTLPLQLSAIGALGILGAGDADVKSFLESLLQTDDVRLQLAAQQALRRIAQQEQTAARAAAQSH